MQSSKFEGIHPTPDDMFQIYQVLKFYYPELDSLTMDAIAEIAREEFGCKCRKIDVYIYLMTLPQRDLNADLKYNDV
jgi:hypothetical protein